MDEEKIAVLTYEYDNWRTDGEGDAQWGADRANHGTYALAHPIKKTQERSEPLQHNPRKTRRPGSLDSDFTPRENCLGRHTTAKLSVHTLQYLASTAGPLPMSALETDDDDMCTDIAEGVCETVMDERLVRGRVWTSLLLFTDFFIR